MSLPIVNAFTPPYEIWTKRQATVEEIQAAGRLLREVNDELIGHISNAADAARRLLAMSDDPEMVRFIKDALSGSTAHRAWRDAMPQVTPAALSTYQKSYSAADLARVSDDINEFGFILPAGQSLFHGGLWWGGTDTVSKRPLSTSLCPQVAVQNALYSAKAFDAGRLDLIVLTAKSPSTNAFIYRPRGTTLGHEWEVLLAAGANLTRTSESLIRNDFSVSKWEHGSKLIPAYVVEIEVS